MSTKVNGHHELKNAELENKSGQIQFLQYPGNVTKSRADSPKGSPWSLSRLGSVFQKPALTKILKSLGSFRSLGSN